jgi:hypothetical protein
MLFKDKSQSANSLLGNASHSTELTELLNAIGQNPQLMHEILAYFYKFKADKKTGE